MITLDVAAVIKALASLRQLEAVIRHAQDTEKSKKTNPMDRKAADIVRSHLDDLDDAISGLKVGTTAVAVGEMRTCLDARKIEITYQSTADYIRDVAVTFRRELSLMKAFCVEASKENYFAIDFSMFGTSFETGFASAVFEIDEAGKCHALGRSTACVFHLMRAMEVGINAVAASLGIAAPTKGADRSWGKILEKIRTELDKRSAAKPQQWAGNDKNFFAEVYASLDAVRVAWRNTTMHVENKYTDDEAEHIFVAVRGFMKRLSGRMDEQGKPLA